VPAAYFAKLVEQPEPLSIRHSVGFETLQFVSAWGSGEGEKAYLIHFINTLLNFWLWIPQKLEERSNPREDFSTLPLLAGWRKCAVHNREFASSSWFVMPASCDHVPNVVLQ